MAAHIPFKILLLASCGATATCPPKTVKPYTPTSMVNPEANPSLCPAIATQSIRWPVNLIVTVCYPGSTIMAHQDTSVPD